MDRQKTIELLKQKSKEAVYVASLPYNNNEYLPWRRNIEDILETAFGITSTEYARVANRRLKVRGTSREIQQGYVRYIQRIQMEVNSIIQKYEILGIETEPDRVEEPPKDTAELPVNLFDKMQFHPKVIEASKSLFESGHYAQAIFEAFKAVEDFVRNKTGLSLYGKQLMAQAFNEDNPLITVTEAGMVNRDVQEGFKFLFMGATVGIRNPKAHHRIIQDDPFITLEYLGFASFLLKRIGGWQVNQKNRSKNLDHQTT